MAGRAATAQAALTAATIRHTPTEADGALEHISEPDAALHTAGAPRITGYELRDKCEVRVPTFVDSQP